MSREEIKNYKMHAIKVITQEPYRTMVEKILLEKEIYKDIQAGLNPSEPTQKELGIFMTFTKFLNIIKIPSHSTKTSF